MQCTAAIAHVLLKQEINNRNLNCYLIWIHSFSKPKSITLQALACQLATKKHILTSAHLYMKLMCSVNTLTAALV